MIYYYPPLAIMLIGAGFHVWDMWFDIIREQQAQIRTITSLALDD